MTLNRKVISVDNGVFLCDDGTMWERVERTNTSCDSGAWNGTVTTASTEWVQVENVPQVRTVVESEPKRTVTVKYSDIKYIKG